MVMAIEDDAVLGAKSVHVRQTVEGRYVGPVGSRDDHDLFFHANAVDYVPIKPRTLLGA
jgi:hypothetical protein